MEIFLEVSNLLIRVPSKSVVYFQARKKGHFRRVGFRFLRLLRGHVRILGRMLRGHVGVLGGILRGHVGVLGGVLRSHGRIYVRVGCL